MPATERHPELVNSVVDGLIAQSYQTAFPKDVSPRDAVGQLSRIIKDQKNPFKTVLESPRAFEYWRQVPALAQLAQGKIVDTSLAQFRDWNPGSQSPTQWLLTYRNRQEVLSDVHRRLPSGDKSKLPARPLGEETLFTKFFKNSWEETARPLHREYLARLSKAGCGPDVKMWHTIKDGLYTSTITHMFYPDYQQIVERIQKLCSTATSSATPDLSEVRSDYDFVVNGTERMKRRHEYLGRQLLSEDENRPANSVVKLVPVVANDPENSVNRQLSAILQEQVSLSTVLPQRATSCCFAFAGSKNRADCCVNCPSKQFVHTSTVNAKLHNRGLRLAA